MSSPIRNWVLKSIIILESGLLFYLVVVSIVGGRSDFLKVYRPEFLRWFLPIILFCAYGAYRQYLAHKKRVMGGAREGDVDSPGDESAAIPAPRPATVAEKVVPAADAAPEAVEVVPAVQPEQTTGVSDAAEEAWKKARSIDHRYIPDPNADAEYLGLVNFAAREGYGEAMLKMAEYANRRGCRVEEYFWLSMAKMNGVNNIATSLKNCQRNWVALGCNPEYANEYSCFSSLDGSFARALLNLDTRINAPLARQRLKELAASGYDYARKFVK